VIPSHKDIYFNKKNFKTLRSLKTLSERIKIPMVSLAMSWVLANKNITSVIIGARNISQLGNALDALNNKVDDAIIHEIDQFVTVLSHD
jgi:L-glyceraldehyde 3-phosphate reductase